MYFCLAWKPARAKRLHSSPQELQDLQFEDCFEKVVKLPESDKYTEVLLMFLKLLRCGSGRPEVIGYPWSIGDQSEDDCKHVSKS